MGLKPSDCVHVGPLSSPSLMIIFTTFTGIALFNGMELLVTIFANFRLRRSCYFYSLVVSTIGVVLYSTFVFIMIFGNDNMYAIVAVISFGRICMVTGQSMVLWSRLHIVFYNPQKLKWILYMIICTAVLIHVPLSTTVFKAIKFNAINPNYVPFNITEKVGVVVFSIQEFIISTVYMVETGKLLKTGEIFQNHNNKRNSRRIMKQLFVANIVLILIDILLLLLEFLALWGVWCSFKGMGYSIKLKIEFWILSQLRDHTLNTREDQDDNIRMSSHVGKNLHSNGHSNSQPVLSSFTERAICTKEIDGEHIVRTTEIAPAYLISTDTISPLRQ